MGCELHPKVVYTQFSALVKHQKEILQGLVKEVALFIPALITGVCATGAFLEVSPAPELEEKVYGGIGELFLGPARLLNPKDIPGVQEAGYVAPHLSAATWDPDRLAATLKAILTKVKAHQSRFPLPLSPHTCPG